MNWLTNFIRPKIKALVKKAEDLVASLGGAAAAPAADLSPVNVLAARLKEALAANTIGGKAEDDSRYRNAIEDVRQAQAAWSRLGPVAEPARRQLTDRFQKAVRKVTEKAEAAARQAGSAGGGNRGPQRSGGGRPGGPGGSGGDRPRQPRPQPDAAPADK